MKTLHLAFIAIFPVLSMVGCKKKKKEEEPQPVQKPVVFTPQEYAYFRGSIDGKPVNYTAYLSPTSTFTSYISNHSLLTNGESPSRFTWGSSLVNQKTSWSITLSKGFYTAPMGQLYATKAQFYNFFTTGKFPLSEESMGNGVQLVIAERNGSGEEYNLYYNKSVPISDSNYVEFTKITAGTTLGEPTVDFEAKVNAILYDTTSGKRVVIRNGVMKGSFESGWTND